MFVDFLCILQYKNPPPRNFVMESFVTESFGLNFTYEFLEVFWNFAWSLIEVSCAPGDVWDGAFQVLRTSPNK